MAEIKECECCRQPISGDNIGRIGAVSFCLSCYEADEKECPLCDIKECPHYKHPEGDSMKPRGRPRKAVTAQSRTIRLKPEIEEKITSLVESGNFKNHSVAINSLLGAALATSDSSP